MGSAVGGMIEITCFGPLELRSGSARLRAGEIGGPKPRRLLKLLVLARGRHVTKDAISAELWDGRRPLRPNATIETYVSILRRALGAIEGGSSLIITESGAYRIDADSIEVDLDRFAELLEAAGASDRPRPLLEAALEVARGDLFSGDPELGAVGRARQEYRSLRDQVTLDVGRIALAEGDWQGALVYATALLARQPTSEAACRLAMIAAYRVDRRDESLRIFDRCRVALAEQLDSAPGPDLIALHGAMQRRIDPELLPVAETSAGPTRVEPQSPFVEDPRWGRTSESLELRAHVKGALRRFSLIAVEGEFGVGKSHTLDSLASTLRQERVGIATCSDLYASLPNSTLMTALRDAFGEHPFLEPPARSDELARWSGDAETQGLENVVDLVRRQAPVVLIFDQVELADWSTIRAMGYLRDRCRDVGGAIVYAYDPAAISYDHPLRHLQPDEIVRLSRLRPSELAAIGDPSIWERSGGLPLLVHGLLALRNDGLDLTARSQPDWTPVCAKRVLDRIRRLGVGPHQLAIIAAVLDDSLDLNAAAAAVQRDVMQVAEDCDVLVRRGVMCADGVRLVLRDPLVRDIMVADTLPAHRETIRRRYEAALDPYLHARALEN